MNSLSVSQQWSRDLARSLGEDNGRSVSRRLADGLWHSSDKTTTPERDVDVVHLGMATAGVMAMAAPKAVGVIAAISFLGFGLLWVAGKRPRYS